MDCESVKTTAYFPSWPSISGFGVLSFATAMRTSKSSCRGHFGQNRFSEFIPNSRKPLLPASLFGSADRMTGVGRIQQSAQPPRAPLTAQS
jgi:hypothetical protein